MSMKQKHAERFLTIDEGTGHTLNGYKHSTGYSNLSPPMSKNTTLQALHGTTKMV